MVFTNRKYRFTAIGEPKREQCGFFFTASDHSVSFEPPVTQTYSIARWIRFITARYLISPVPHYRITVRVITFYMGWLNENDYLIGVPVSRLSCEDHLLFGVPVSRLGCGGHLL